LPPLPTEASAKAAVATATVIAATMTDTATATATALTLAVTMQSKWVENWGGLEYNKYDRRLQREDNRDCDQTVALLLPLGQKWWGRYHH
jgi:hypothetical protein